MANMIIIKTHFVKFFSMLTKVCMSDIVKPLYPLCARLLLRLSLHHELVKVDFQPRQLYPLFCQAWPTLCSGLFYLELYTRVCPPVAALLWRQTAQFAYEIKTPLCKRLDRISKVSDKIKIKFSSFPIPKKISENPKKSNYAVLANLRISCHKRRRDKCGTLSQQVVAASDRC